MIKFECKFNKEAFKAFQNHYAKKTLPSVFIVMAIMFFVLLSFDFSISNLIFVAIFCFVIFPLLYFLIFRIGSSSALKNNKFISDSSDDVFVFTDDTVYVKSTVADYRETRAIPYDFFFSVEETKTHYFLFLAQNQALIVSKDGLKDGSIDRLNDILRLRLDGKKFKPCKK